MTPTEKAKRSDALYYETVSVNKRVLCDMVANREADLEDALHREADLEDAQAENEHMWLKALAVMGELQEENERLKADNAKLRGLVRDVYTLHWNGLDCTECPWFDECDTTGGCPWLSIFADRMRKLGVEVNDG